MNNVEYDITMHGLYKMYVNLFEKLGWMVLAKFYKDNQTPKSYISKLKILKRNIEKKSKELKSNKDKIHDCDIMKKNINLLIKHAKKDFQNLNENVKINNIKNNNLKDLPEYDVTMFGIHKWYAEMFEKLGWMIIAHSHKDTERIKSYYNGLLKLYKTLQMKSKTYNDEDRRMDAEIMMKNIAVLISHVKNDFNMK
jgi:uncharacterized pyridoxal phosphate-containing UPF0001 family protein